MELAGSAGYGGGRDQPYVMSWSMMLLRSMQQVSYSEHNHGHLVQVKGVYTHFN